MKVQYIGIPDELTPPQRRKLESRFSKLGKLLDRKGEEREGHVFLSAQRHLFKAEFTVNFYGQTLAAEAREPDQYTALSSAADKLEKQLIKAQDKWREHQRDGARAAPLQAAAREAATETNSRPGQRIFRVNTWSAPKPMTVEEAVLALEKNRDYIVYRDAENERISVLVRRRDGNFDLIET